MELPLIFRSLFDHYMNCYYYPVELFLLNFTTASGSGTFCIDYEYISSWGENNRTVLTLKRYFSTHWWNFVNKLAYMWNFDEF